ncbi:MAG: polysaccharide biosynthesis tyrosine autokinase [Anaerolineales bacterium]
MEIRRLFIILRRWLWLIIIGFLLGLAGGVVLSIVQTPVYTATTKVLATRTKQETETDTVYYLSDQQLVQTYIQLFKSKPILDQVYVETGVRYDSTNLNSIAVEQILDTQIIQITVADTDPETAARVANALVRVMVVQNETLQAGRYAATEEALQLQIQQIQQQMADIQAQLDQIYEKGVEDQIKEVDAQIATLREEISALQKDIARLDPPLTAQNRIELNEKKATLDLLQPVLYQYEQIRANLIFLGSPSATGADNRDPKITQLQSTLSMYQQMNLSLMNNMESLRLVRLQNTPGLVLLEEAVPNTRPVRPRPLQNIAFGGMLGLIGAAALVYLLEIPNVTLKTPEDVMAAAKLPTIGYIVEMRKSTPGSLFVLKFPYSPITDAFRALQANLSLGNTSKPIHSILITSFDAAAGKTTVATNLAVVFTQSGKKVILVDADLREPEANLMLGVDNPVGLSNLLQLTAELEEALARPQNLPELFVITAGARRNELVGLINADRIRVILDNLKDKGDLVILDGPPLTDANAQVIAAQADGVLLVIRAGQTAPEVARLMVDQLTWSGANILGVVLNDIPADEAVLFT